MISWLKRNDYIPPHKLYTLAEEIANSITHGIGAALSLTGMTVLIFLAALERDPLQIVSISIYGSTLVILYLASTLYHSFQHPRVKHILQVIDHSAVYLLIAGTYTPFLLVGLRGAWGWSFLALIWGMALLGIAFKILFIRHFQRLSALGYILMGWLGVLVLRELYFNLPTTGIIWLGAGGAAYTIGVVFAAWRKPFTHTVWHLFVLGGSICHYFAVLHLIKGI
jgi:hemolysin III